MKTPEEIKARQAEYRAANKEKMKVYHVVWYAANAEEKKPQRAAYRAANREKINARNAAYRAANPEKIKAKQTAWRAANAEKINARKAAYAAANPEKRRAERRTSNYGLSPGAYQLLLLMQRNACAICKEIFSKTPAVDHCHKTGEVRGLLCAPCNTALGGFRDSIVFLKSAEEYLQG